MVSFCRETAVLCGCKRKVTPVARPPKCRCICQMPRYTRFDPKNGAADPEPVILQVDEFEVLRLLDYAQFSQEKCAQRMNISRTTVTRMYDLARQKVIRALVLGLPLVIEGGEVLVCRQMKPQCRGEQFCCHAPEEPAEKCREEKL